MCPPQDKLKFYRLINFDGGPDFVANTLRPKNMFMKLYEHFHQALRSTFHASRKPGGIRASGRACVLTAVADPFSFLFMKNEAFSACFGLFNI